MNFVEKQINFKRVYLEGANIEDFEDNDDIRKFVINENLQVEFVFDERYITASQNFLKALNTTFLSKQSLTNFCSADFVNKKRHIVVSCDKNVLRIHKDFLASFPKLKFEHKEMNFTFEFSALELWEERGDRIFLRVVVDVYHYMPWRLGRVFIEKYGFSYDDDNKLIGLYFVDKEENYSIKSRLYFSIWISLLILVGGVCFLFGRRVVEKVKKVRACELEDKYEYMKETEMKGK